MPVPPFLKKSFEIFSDPANAGICGWGENGDSIFIINIDEFARVVLPKYFKHANYASFTRQLHKYDFHKTVHNPRHGEFKHQYFIKDRPDLLELIQRKVYVSKSSSTNHVSPDHISGNTDGETDGSSDKDGSALSDMDFDFLGEDGVDEDEEFDFEVFDEIESSVERGIIAFDDERISVLEKRQASLMLDNEEMKSEIAKTVAQNNHMAKTVDCLLSHALEGGEQRSRENAGDAPGGIDDLCAVMQSKCTLGSLPDEVESYLSTVL